MDAATARAIVDIGEIYLMIGAVFAAAFLLVGVDRIDPAAHGAYAARVILFPSLVLLWPVALVRWIQLERRGRR